METEWDKKIVSQELLQYLREQLISALETKDKTDRRFGEIMDTATVLQEAIWSNQHSSAIAGMLGYMVHFCINGGMGVWFKCDSTDFSIEKIEAVYSDRTDAKE